ncbi:hypothetical protein V6U90_19780 [Micromonospora sp. CPCC 206060]|uniref:hypothetical protein n=1 Tax=Micromonospora sp. CPCC 206060 TaxID=3122406 RepID=UPI002FF2CCC3
MPTYEVMARDGLSNKSSLSKADKGINFPSKDVTLAYVRACNGPVADWKAKWEQVAKKIGHPSVRSKRPLPLTSVATPLDSVNPVDALTVEEFRARLRQVRERVGNPSYKEIEVQARLKGLALPASTVFDMLKPAGKTLPRDDRIVVFLTVCDIPQREHDLWIRTRQSIKARQIQVSSSRPAISAALRSDEDTAATPTDSLLDQSTIKILQAENHQLRLKLKSYEVRLQWPTLDRDDPRGAIVRPYVIQQATSVPGKESEPAPGSSDGPQSADAGGWRAATEPLPRFRGVARVPSPWEITQETTWETGYRVTCKASYGPRLYQPLPMLASPTHAWLEDPYEHWIRQFQAQPLPMIVPPTWIWRDDPHEQWIHQFQEPLLTNPVIPVDHADGGGATTAPTRYVGDHRPERSRWTLIGNATDPQEQLPVPPSWALYVNEQTGRIDQGVLGIRLTMSIVVVAATAVVLSVAAASLVYEPSRDAGTPRQLEQIYYEINDLEQIGPLSPHNPQQPAP